ncbi:MAG: PCMD domain-containing protein, partial [Muribaculaceae bacterium]|nr:PCMD domain-containing protein [Muribaculaceae bacterium]
GSSESALKINFEEEFTNSLPAGEYEFIYNVTDANNRESSLTRTLRITDASLALNEVNDYDVWAKEATISADVLQDDYGNATFQYRQSGSASWINVAPSVDMTAKLTGLTPGADYEYRIISDKDNFESDVKTFTTEAALQLPNSGFEEWNTSSKAWLLCSDESSMFWDSGNHGSSTMKKNISQPDDAIKHSGNYSIKMESQFVGIGAAGKFAAGNAFIGKYLKTDGTDGILGWGRPFASRPKALRGYVKYNPELVQSKEACDYIKEGDMDQGIIYIAVLDATKSGDSDYPDWPVVIRTKTEKLFNKDGNNVIAYGEKVFTSATAGDGLIEFEIPLNYKKTNEKAVNIMITMSASRYGDYFAGGRGSTMWVDDLELVY